MLRFLLDGQFPEREALTSQLEGLEVVPIDAEGSLRLATKHGHPAEYHHPVPVEAWVEDSDGVPLYALLHIDRDGFMQELEFYKADGSPIVSRPDPLTWHRMTRFG